MDFAEDCKSGEVIASSYISESPSTIKGTCCSFLRSLRRFEPVQVLNITNSFLKYVCTLMFLREVVVLLEYTED